jgi:bis(5'-nucleosyl)-tetraphosphatase (symmetrical)
MATYAVGDLQGCLSPLQTLLDQVSFDPASDHLWLVGDLVNRGDQCLATLNTLYDLRSCITCVLGNHDLHLIAHYYGYRKLSRSDTLATITKASNADELIQWLRQQPLMHWQPELNTAMVHAGINPLWDIQTARQLAHEVELALRDDASMHEFLAAMYGNEPDVWDDTLTGTQRLRVITNYFTRMRFCDRRGRLNFSHKGAPTDAPEGFQPWYELYLEDQTKPRVVFGHWAALNGETQDPRALGLDTGCVWGNCMTMVCLETGQQWQTRCA